ncbi:hypothetical protein SAMN05216474_1646 [Lishizhenia tianjinensis]|uniref:MetA-pathway of phenol degradation n=1 Tax=Lishizhenia tianjinensis TaxID=477690 RepID=A0A1I6ZV73_9FLAO|nr:hypothetical protein [Lishizhenia tianjinensis]SFT66590.1 hypothetical protein SAMN05216474_1646 [Lishizhenia tianjinensis]
MKALLTSLILFITFASSAQGLVDGFFKGKGRTDMALGFAYEKAKLYYAQNTIEYGRELFIFNTFAEYGITNKWDVIASAPIINGKPQDASFFTKYEVLKWKGLSVIPAVGISFPMSNYNTETSQSIGQRATNLQPKLVLQYKPNTPWFIQTQATYQNTLVPVPHAWNWSAKIGYGAGKWYGDLWFENQTSLGDAIFLGPIPYNDFRELGVSYQRFGGVIYYQLKERFGISVSASKVLNGRNIGSAGIVGVSGVWKFRVE